MSTSRMHADEVETDVSLVRRLLSGQFPRWADLRIEPVLPWGTDNALYRLGTDMVVRMPRTPRTTETLAKEIRWLPRLAPVLPLAIPAVLAVGEPAHGYHFAWAVYSWLEGETATADRIADRRQAAVDLAHFVAALQRLDPADGPPPGRHNASRGVPLALRGDATRAAIASLSGRIDVAVVTSAWEAALGAPEWHGAPVLIHGDLDSRNVLVRDGRLSAVLDWGCLGVGDPACEVMAAWKLLSAEARDIFRAELSIDEATWARARGWVLSQSLIALAYYTLETNAVLVRESERWMADVLADRALSSH